MQIRNKYGRETSDLKVEIQQLQEIIDSKKIQLRAKKQEMERQIKTEEMQLLSEQQWKELERNPKYKTQIQINQLRRELEQLSFGTGSNDNSRKETESNCSICFEKPNECWGCQECDNWVCQQCKIILENCPHCREDFKNRPMKRYRAVERILLRGIFKSKY